MSRGFTLLEVVVAMAILSVALVAMMQLSSQGLRLLRVSEDYQGAVRLADRLARTTVPDREGVETGQQGNLRWERRVTAVPVPDELTTGAGRQPRLYAVSIAVAWGARRTLELTSLRAVVPSSDGSKTEDAMR